MIKRLILFFQVIVLCASFSHSSPDVYVIQNSSVSFISVASFGKIRGESVKMNGSLDIKKRTFEFSLPACSFEGFLNSTQKKHYCEKFVEEPKYPEMGFKGKIIEEVDLSVPGTYTVRGKGMFLLHGMEKERIIDVQLSVKGTEIIIDAKFKVPVEEHGIKVSKMNSLSMAKVIDVSVKIVMKPS